MFKHALRSYFTTLHPKNFGKVQESPSYFFYSFFFTGIFLAIINDSVEYDLTYKMIPFFLMGWSNRSSRYLLEKNMFLVPMKTEQRKDYIHYVLEIKIGFPLLVGILVECIWSYLYGFQFVRFLLEIFVYGFADIDGTFSILNIIAIGVGVAWLLFFDVYVLCTQYREMMECAVDYERTFYIPGSGKHTV